MSLFHSPRIVTDDLALYVDIANPKSYPGTGTTVNDVSKSLANGTLSGGHTVSDGSVTFSTAATSGRCTHVTNLTSIDNITNSSAFTFSATFRVNSYPAVAVATTCGLLQKSSYNPSYGLNLIYAGDSGGIRTQVQVYGGIRNLTGTAGVTEGRGLISPTAPTALSLGQWYRADMTHEFAGTTHTVKIYLNGSLDITDIQTNSLFPINFENSSSIGINTNVLSGNFIASDITVSNYAVYTRALSAAEVLQNFNALRGRFGI